MIMSRHGYLGALAIAAGWLFSGMGCSSAAEHDGDTGVAQIAISQVPLDGSVGCIAVTATGNHTVSRSFNVSPGQNTVLDMNGLPVGTVSFAGNAYQGPCHAVATTTSPTWLSDPVLASVSNSQPVMVHLTMRRNGKAGVDVDFEDEPTCRANGAPCLAAAECCSQSCVAGTCGAQPPACPPGLLSCNGGCADVTSDPFNCGACGSVCPSFAACQGGACVAAATCVDGIKNGPETDVDCGGPCIPCADGKACQAGFDCLSGLCNNGVCAPAQGQCQVATECPGADTECQMRTCTAGVCGMAFAPFGLPVSAQVIGDCAFMACDGSGGIVLFPDDADVMDDGNQCTSEACFNGTPTSIPVPTGTACNQNGGTICNGAGNCI